MCWCNEKEKPVFSLIIISVENVPLKGYMWTFSKALSMVKIKLRLKVLTQHYQINPQFNKKHNQQGKIRTFMI